MQEPEDSLQWKRGRHRSVNLLFVILLTLVIAPAVYFFNVVRSDYQRYVDPKNWTSKSANVKSVVIQDGDSGYVLVVKMTVDGRDLEDGLAPKKQKDAEARKASILKQGTIQVYRNNSNAFEYSLSPINAGSKKFLPTLMTIVILGGGTAATLVLLWIYLHKQIDVAAGMVHRSRFVADRVKRL